MAYAGTIAWIISASATTSLTQRTAQLDGQRVVVIAIQQAPFVFLVCLHRPMRFARRGSANARDANMIHAIVTERKTQRKPRALRPFQVGAKARGLPGPRCGAAIAGRTVLIDGCWI